MAKDFIVAIELGSAKLTGIAGRKNPDGSITVLAVASEDSASYIRKGVVYSIDKTAQGLSNIITKLKNSLQADITQVYVGIGGQSIHSVRNMVIKDLPVDAIVSQGMVNELMDTNRNMTYPDYEIQDAITEEYKVDLQYQTDPVGIQASRLEGNFINILWRRSFYRNLNKSFDSAGIAIAETYLAPLVMADNVLTEAEKRAGCVLVDLGSETTTVSVYYRDKLRSIAVIPLGGDNITKDLESLQMEEKDAERMKLKYGSALTDLADIDPAAVLPIDNKRTIESRRFIEVVEARTLEIIENVKSFIPAEYADKLLSGIVLTGGGSNMTNIEKAFREATGFDKVRVAKFVTLSINSKDSKIDIAHDGTMNTILSLVARGDMNCAGNAFGESPFDNQHANNVTTAQQSVATTSTATGTSQTVGPTPREIEEERIKREEAERKRIEAERIKQEEAERRRKEEEERKKNSPFGRFFGTLKRFGKTLVEPENGD